MPVRIRCCIQGFYTAYQAKPYKLLMTGEIRT